MSKAVNQTKRRTWNKNEYLAKGVEREAQSRIEERPTPRLPPGAPRNPLEGPRDFKFDFTKEIGKVKVVATSTNQLQRGGFYCEVCDCVMKDSANYVDHLNGKKHQKLLGLSTRTKRSSLEAVQNRMRMKRSESKTTKEYNFEERVDANKRQDEEEKARRKAEKKRRRAEMNGNNYNNNEEDGDDSPKEHESESELLEQPERKRQKIEVKSDSVLENDKDTKEGIKDNNNNTNNNNDKKIKKEPQQEEQQEEEEEGEEGEGGDDLDPAMVAMAAAMGLPMNFGGGKKT